MELKSTKGNKSQVFYLIQSLEATIFTKIFDRYLVFKKNQQQKVFSVFVMSLIIENV